jgi:hypothetical protein
MLSKYQHLGLLMIVGSLLVVPAAKGGGILKGHWYRDPHSSVRSSGGVYMAPRAANYPPPTAHGEMALLYGEPAFPIGIALGANYPPVTNALLRVWVDDNATVWVNGVRTKPQTLAGIHSGSRIFNLTGLVPGQIQEAVVQVQLWNAMPQEERKLVQPGGSYVIRFAPLQPPMEEMPVPRFESPPPEPADPFGADSAISRAEIAAKRSEDAAGKAEAEATKAEKVVEEAKVEIAEQLEEVRKLADAAAHFAKQAARTNTEAFEFLDNDKSVVAWVKYNDDDGSIADLHFDAKTTRSKLGYKETSGALAHLHDIQIVMNYHFTIQSPDASAPGAFKDESTFEMVGHLATFDAGVGEAVFFDEDEPDQHLSADFKTELMNKWSKRYHGGRVKVEIRAIRPNGTEAPVAPVGNRITIEIRLN